MFLMKDNRITPAHIKVSSSPSYTLPELSTVAREYVEAARERWGQQDVVEVELQLSLFLAWLQKKGERG